MDGYVAPLNFSKAGTVCKEGIGERLGIIFDFRSWSTDSYQVYLRVFELVRKELSWVSIDLKRKPRIISLDNICIDCSIT